MGTSKVVERADLVPALREAARIGARPVPEVHLNETGSSALIAWRGAEVRSRVLVHLDGQLDVAWLPDLTVARIAAADRDELSDLERHPYAMPPGGYAGFGHEDYIYAAARLGMIRQLILFDEILYIVITSTLHNLYPGTTATI